jgi:hypothetical protein
MINVMRMRRRNQRAALAAALAGGLLTVFSGSAQVAAQPQPQAQPREQPREQAATQPQPQPQARAEGSSSALGVLARLGDAPEVGEGRAEYPGGPAADELAAVSLGDTGTVDGVTASATGDEDTGAVEAEAGVSELRLELDQLQMARLVSGELRADCSAEPGRQERGSASLSEAVFDAPRLRDVEFAKNPAPNTVVELPGDLGRAVLNEHRTQPDGSLTVTALHLTLDDPDSTYRGELVIGSVNCQAAGADGEDGDGAKDGAKAKDGMASVAGAAEEARTGEAMRDVRFEIVESDGTVAGRCTTDATGTCADNELPPGRYFVCVDDVPDGHRMPHRYRVCSGPYAAEAGEEVSIDRPFEIASSRQSPNRPAGTRA